MKGLVVAVFLTGAFIAGSFATPAAADDRTTCLSNQVTDGSRDACTRAITSGQVSGGDLAFAYMVIGVSFTDAREYDKAIANLNLAIRNAPNNSIPYRKRGLAYLAKGDLDRAIQDFNDALRLNPKFGFVYNDRGVAYYTKGDDDRAIADFNEAIRLEVPNPAFYFDRAMAYERKGDTGMALADYREAMSLDPTYRHVADVIKRIEKK